MDGNSHEKIKQDPNYQELVRRRSSLGWTLSLIMLVIYFGFILLVAFAKASWARRLSDGRHDHRHPDRPVRHRLGVRADRHLCQQGQSDLRRAEPPDRREISDHANALLCLAMAYLPACPRSRLRPARSRAAPSSRPTWTAIGMFVAFVAVHAGDHQVGGLEDQVGGRLLHRRRRHHRLPERPRDRRRLHVGGLVPRHLGPGDRLAAIDGLIYSIGFLVGWPVVTVPDGRAAAQPRQVHLRRRRLLPLRSRPRSASLAASGTLVGRGLLPDRADGRRRPADQAAVRPALLDAPWSSSAC